eukprot:Pgem_evm1s12506
MTFTIATSYQNEKRKPVMKQSTSLFYGMNKFNNNKYNNDIDMINEWEDVTLPFMEEQNNVPKATVDYCAVIVTPEIFQTDYYRARVDSFEKKHYKYSKPSPGSKLSKTSLNKQVS